MKAKFWKSSLKTDSKLVGCLKGVGPVYDPHSNNLKETPRTEKLSGISALPNETNGLQPNNEEHLLDSKIIHSK